MNYVERFKGAFETNHVFADNRRTGVNVTTIGQLLVIPDHFPMLEIIDSFKTI